MIFKALLRSVLFVSIATGLFACSSGGDGNTTVVTTETNAAPVASAIAVDVTEDGAVEAILSAVDADGDALTFSVVSQPANGNVVIVANKATYTPVENFFGEDSFSFKASDGTSDSAVSVVTLKVAGVADDPIAKALTANTTEASAVEIILDATDADGDSLTYKVVSQPTNGLLSTLNDSKIIYTPASGFTGTDSFTYSANDGDSDSEVVGVTINVTSVENSIPVALDVTASTNEDTAVEVTLQASDADNNSLTYEIVAQPARGALSAIVGNKVTYTPEGNFYGGDSFSYRASDDASNSEVAIVSFSIESVNDAPVSANVAATTDENESLEVTLQASDVESDSLSFEIVTQPAHGTLSTVSENKVTYTPATDFSGNDSFTFRASDASSNSAISTVTLTVNNINSVPASQAGSASTDMEKAITLTLLAADADTDAVLTYTIAEQPEHGSLSSITGDQVTYTPATGYVGSDSFVFKVNDGEADSNNSVFTLSVAPLNFGQIIDSPVSGLHYSTGGFEGITDSEGRFRYNNNGDSVYFSLGNKLVLGQALADEKVHIYDFKENEQEAVSGKNKRIAQILQSLDVDEDSSNGIQLPSDIREKINESPKLDFLAGQVDFDEALKEILTDWEIDNFVSYDDAKSDADKFALELLTECPLTLPTMIGITANSNMSCLDRARVNFHYTRISPLLRQPLLEAFGQATIVEEEYTEDAVGEILETNPVLSALQSFDALVDLGGSLDEVDEHEIFVNLIPVLTKSIETVVHLIFVDTESEDTKEELLQASKYMDITTDLIQGMLRTPYCVQIIIKGEKSSNSHIAHCTKGIINIIETSKHAEYFQLADDGTVESVIKAFVASLQAVIAVAEFTEVDKSLDDRIRAAFGLAEAMVGVAREAVVLSLANSDDVKPGVNLSYITISSIDTIFLPFLATAKECARKPSGAQLAKCYSAASRELGKLAARAAFAAAGIPQVVYHIKTMNDSIIADKVLEEFLAAGSANHKDVYNKYGIVSITNSGGDSISLLNIEELIAKIGESHGYTPISHDQPWLVDAWRAHIDRAPFSVARTKVLVTSYYSRIVNETPLDFYSINAGMSATIHSNNRGHATVEVVADLSDIGLNAFSATCYSDEDSSYPLNLNTLEPWSSDMENLIPATFEISYSSSGARGIFCNFYRKSNSSYIGSQAVSIVIDGYDDDADGMLDQWELQFPKDTNNPDLPYLDITTDDSSSDVDSDGLSNQQEYALNTNPIDNDTDDDGILDGWEVENSLNPLTDDASEDQDSDGISNIQEYNYETAPFTNFSAGVVGTNTAALSWDAVEGATYYNVCYSKETIPDNQIVNCRNFSGGTWTSGIYNQTSHLIRDLEQGVAYTFRVVALNDSDDIRLFSDEVTIAIPVIVTSRYKKLSSIGVELEATADHWSCVKDNETGLVWESKTEDGGLHDKTNTYTWYNPEVSSIEGVGGTENGNYDTDTFVHDVNDENLCGLKNWRLPSLSELQSLAVIEGGVVSVSPYFPHMQITDGSEPPYGYWSFESIDSGAKGLQFSNAQQWSRNTMSKEYVRLVSYTSAQMTTGELNDTGITQCADNIMNGLSCPISLYPNQDAQYGRDFDENDDTNGHAGFSFTKIDASGNALPADADKWSCVLDNVTGFMWEIKQDEGLHRLKDYYQWYSNDDVKNGGAYDEYPYSIYGSCYGAEIDSDNTIPALFCSTQKFVERVNQKGLCGANDWRLPSRETLRSIVNYSFDLHYEPSIDTSYFNVGISPGSFWTSTPAAYDATKAWYLGFHSGKATAINKQSQAEVMLVRGSGS